MSQSYTETKGYDEACYLDGKLRVERDGDEFQVRQVQTGRLVAACLSRVLAEEVALRLQTYEELSGRNEKLSEQNETLLKTLREVPQL